MLTILQLMLLSRAREAMQWGRVYLPPHQYYEISRSRKRMTVSTIACCLCPMPIIIICACIAILGPFSHLAEAGTMPSGATSSREARIDYDDNVYWTHDSKVYKEPLEDYGLNPDDYKPQQVVTIYIDDEQNLYQISDDSNADFRQIEIIISLICAFAIPGIIIAIWITIIVTKTAKPYRDYLKWYNQRFYNGKAY